MASHHAALLVLLLAASCLAMRVSARHSLELSHRHSQSYVHSHSYDQILIQNRSDPSRFPSSNDPPVLLWPMPAEFTRGNSTIFVSPSLQIVADTLGQNSLTVLDAFDRYKRLIFAHRRTESLDPFASEGNHLQRLFINVLSDDSSLEYDTDESYHLYVPEDTTVEDAYLEGSSVYGVLRGLETFSQLCAFNFSNRMVEIANVPWNIKDTPRFKFRGLLIDTSRHYQPIAAIKQVIDSMAYAKLNVLHWHIVDEESFPLEIPSLPKLWNGAYTSSERYTVDDAQEIVGYAKARGISVMAEIDVPGHGESWGYGYPDLWPSYSCREPLDVSKNFTFEVIDSILSDLKKIFPFGFFHLGGDEVHTDCWENTAHIKKWLDESEMTPYQAYIYFVLRAQKIAISHGWVPVNWEETFNAFSEQLDPTTIVHNWLGPGVAPKVVAKGYQCIVSNQGVWYLDHLDVPWESVYMYDPLAGITNSSEQALVIGGEVCMWGEMVDASDLLQTIWPRAAAAAERLWSPVDYTASSIDEARTRLENFRCLLNQRNIAAAPVTTPLARQAPWGPGSCYFQ